MKQTLAIVALIFCCQFSQAQSYRTGRAVENRKYKKTKIEYGKNIISFCPIQIVEGTSLPQNSNNTTTDNNPGVTVGLSYERIFNNDFMSFKLPVNLSIVKNYYYIMPTLKLYPTKQGAVRYAVGPQLMFAMGDAAYTKYTYVNGVYTTQKSELTRKQFGFLLNNSLNFTLGKSLYVGLDASLGIIYYDNLPKDAYSNSYNVSLSPFGNNGDSGVKPAFQINFNMGYRF